MLVAEWEMGEEERWGMEQREKHQSLAEFGSPDRETGISDSGFRGILKKYPVSPAGVFSVPCPCS